MLRLKHRGGFTPSEIARPRPYWGAQARARFPTGFTLIEVILVLAISTALAGTLIWGYNAQQGRARFSDSVESVVSVLEKVKSEVIGGYSTGSGNKADRVFFGKVVTFSPMSSDYTVQVLTADYGDTLDNLCITQPDGDCGAAEEDHTIPWGIRFIAAEANYRVVVFARNLTDGTLRTYVLHYTDDLTDPATYNSSVRTQSILDFQNDDSPPLEAKIYVAAPSGQVTRNYEN